MVAPLRILAVSHSANLDGAEQVLLETLRGLHTRGHRLHALLPGQGPLSKALESAGIPVEFMPLPWWILPAGQFDAGAFLAQLGPQVEQLRARIRDLQIQIVHTSTSVVLHGALAAALENRPHLWQVHEMLGEPACGLDPTLGTAATWQCMARLNAPPRGRLVVASAAMQQRAAMHCSDLKAPLTLLPHGHDLTAYEAVPALVPPPAAKRPSASRPVPVRFVVIASVTPRKGLDVLIRALGEVVANGTNAAALPPFTVEIIGAAHDRAYLKRLQAQAKTAHVAKLIQWSGYCNDLPERLRGARAVLHASRNDPSPVGLILAMAAARPIVATRCGGPEKMIEDGVSGRLLAVDDATSLSAEIRRLLTDPAYGLTWGTAARTRAVTTYALDVYLDRLEALYGEMLSAGGPLEAAAAAASVSPAWTLDPALLPVILDAIHRHTGAAAGTLKPLTPRQQKALSGIVKSAKLLKKTLPAGLYDKLAGLW